MPQYRIYFLDPQNHHIQRAENLVADSDTAAVQRTTEHVAGQPVELWDGDRKVARIEAGKHSPPPRKGGFQHRATEDSRRGS